MTGGQPLLAEELSDIITKGHWVQRGFASTDLDHQPKEHGIKKTVIAAMVANGLHRITRLFRNGDRLSTF